MPNLADDMMAIYEKYAPKDKQIPGMLSKQDRSIYFSLARQATMEGLIIDAGCLVGASTMQLIDALLQNNEFIRGKHKVLVYDNFKIEPYIINWINKYGGGIGINEKSFYKLFLVNMHAYLDCINVNICDLSNFIYEYKSPISLLCLDCCKSVNITDRCIRQFFPYLIPDKSYVIHQDYIHPMLPHIHVSMEKLSNFFEPVAQIDGYSSYAWRCIQKITTRDIETIFGKDDGNFSWYFSDKNVNLLKKIIKDLPNKISKAMFVLIILVMQYHLKIDFFIEDIKQYLLDIQDDDIMKENIKNVQNYLKIEIL